MMQTLWQDLRYTLRTLRGNPGFAIVAVLALALGIGANAAIFTVLNAIVLRPLDFDHSERLVVCWESNPEKNFLRLTVSAPNLTDWKAQNHVFEQMAAFRDRELNIGGVGEPQTVKGAVFSAGMFPLLRVKPLLGRVFTPEEDQSGREHVVVLSHKLWQRRYGGDAGVIGKTIKLNSKDYTVIGVMDAGFKFPTPEYSVYLPIAFSPKELASRGSKNYLVVARLKDGVTMAEAQNDISAITERIKQTDPEGNAGFGATLQSLRALYAEDSVEILFVLFAAVGFVLLIACTNISNLLLVRAAARQKEIAIRLSLGASRSRVIRQLLTESISIALAGGVLGLILAAWGKDLIVAFAPDDLFRVKDIGIDFGVLAFTLLLSILTGVIFGLVPALRASKPNLNETLKDANRGGVGGGGRHRLRKLLVVIEVALAMVLLVGAGLMFRTIRAMRADNPGFN